MVEHANIDWALIVALIALGWHVLKWFLDRRDRTKEEVKSLMKWRQDEEDRFTFLLQRANSELVVNLEVISWPEPSSKTECIMELVNSKEFSRLDIRDRSLLQRLALDLLAVAKHGIISRSSMKVIENGKRQVDLMTRLAAEIYFAVERLHVYLNERNAPYMNLLPELRGKGGAKITEEIDWLREHEWNGASENLSYPAK